MVNFRNKLFGLSNFPTNLFAVSDKVAFYHLLMWSVVRLFDLFSPIINLTYVFNLFNLFQLLVIGNCRGVPWPPLPRPRYRPEDGYGPEAGNLDILLFLALRFSDAIFVVFLKSQLVAIRKD